MQKKTLLNRLLRERTATTVSPCRRKVHPNGHLWRQDYWYNLSSGAYGDKKYRPDIYFMKLHPFDKNRGILSFCKPWRRNHNHGPTFISTAKFTKMNQAYCKFFGEC